MKKLVYLLAGLLLFAACDRFEHEFEPDVPDENPVFEFWNDFAGAWQLITPVNIQPVMDHYDDGYSNNFLNKQDIEEFYLSLFDLADSVTFTTDLIDPVPTLGRESYDLIWQLIVSDAISAEILLDSTFTDIVIDTEDGLMFYGNQAVPPIYQKILAELGTGVWCNSCPYAEEALDQLKQEYGDQFHYIEYHLGDQLEIEGNSSILSYYGIGTFPTAVFQGQTTYTGGNEETYDFYHDILIQYLNQPAEVILSDLAFTVSGDQLNCSVMVSINGELSDTDLMLKYSLVEEESRINNYNGDPCLQVPLFNGSQSLEGADLEQQQDFIVTLPEDPIPDDIVLLVWVQTVADEFDPETCKIHNVIEQDITLGR